MLDLIFCTLDDAALCDCVLYEVHRGSSNLTKSCIILHILKLTAFFSVFL
jgi:hypothetical protein